MPIGFALNVPAWYTFPAGATRSIRCLRPAYAPTGNPPVQLYYCGYDNAQSNIGGKPGECALDAQCGSIKNEENALILGKICNTATSMLPNTSGPSMFGACQ